MHIETLCKVSPPELTDIDLGHDDHEVCNKVLAEADRNGN
jgi:hypothetical protein